MDIIKDHRRQRAQRKKAFVILGIGAVLLNAALFVGAVAVIAFAVKWVLAA